MVAFDWSRRGWRHGPVSGPVHGAVALTAAGVLGELPLVTASPQVAFGAGVVGAGVSVLWSRADGAALPRVLYRAGVWAGGGGWLAHVLTAGWSPGVVWTLAGGTILTASVNGLLAARDRRAARASLKEAAAKAAAMADEMEQDRLHDVAGRWERHLAKHCKLPGCKVLAIEPWRFTGPDGVERETGYTLEVRLPTGATWPQVAARADKLASAEDLEEGCGVGVGPGRSRRRVLIEVSTYDALREDIPLPSADQPRKASDLLDIGILRNGLPALVPFLAESILLIGETGSGKSNQLQTMVARLLESDCRLVCVIDFNGGGVALDWIAAWAEGKAKKPAIFWVADNPEEAVLLCRWLLAVIEHRKRAYHVKNRARNDDKIEPTADVPQLALVCDEFGALPDKIKEMVTQIGDRGRAAAVRPLTCALRATSKYVPVGLKTQARVRLGMRVTNKAELSHLLESGAPSPEDCPFPGYGHGRVGRGPTWVFKGYRTTPEIIYERAVATDEWRPDLDESTLNMSPYWRQVVDERWERSAHLVAAARGEEYVPAGRTGGGSGSGTGSGPGGGTSAGPGARTGGPERTGTPGGGTGDPFQGVRDAAARLRDVAQGRTGGPADPGSTGAPGGTGEKPGTPGGADGGDVRDEFAALVGEVALPELLVRALAAFGDAERMHTAVIAEQIGARTETLGRLLDQLGVNPLRNAFALDGRTRRGYERKHLEEAADRINAGDLVPTDEVMRWRPERKPRQPF